ncbi:sensor histidine kinase [Streptomyces sp. NPDC059456]|uniref:sensor histidine kinase n=1 Tax=Streptomyces sp. NPDC059456 TaxID=3346838 RepID=UPI0036C8D3AC
MTGGRTTGRFQRLVWLLFGVGGSASHCWSGAYHLFRADTACPVVETVILVVVPLVMLAAHRFPLPVFFAALSCLYAGTCYASVAALYPVALAADRRWVAPACALAFTVVRQTTAHRLTLDSGLPSNVIHVIAFLWSLVPPVLLGALNRARAELAVRLTDLEAVRERERTLLAEQVLATERARLARDMHDTVAHRVSLISVQSAALQLTTTDPEVRGTAAALRRLAADTLAELRQMLGVLRAGAGTTGGRLPEPRLRDVPQLVNDSHLDVELTLETPIAGPLAARWPDAVHGAVFRTVQESLTNARKHAPGAPIAVRLYDTGRQLHLDVHNGPSAAHVPRPELPCSGYGLTGLRERARLAGGTLTAGPTDDGGYLLRARYPAPPT